MKVCTAVTVTLIVALMSLLTETQAQTLFSTDFNAGDGGFTVNTPAPYDGPWTYRALTGSWGQDGQSAENRQPNTSILNSPAVVIPGTNSVTLSFDHRYSFEAAGAANHWDGGQVGISVNGGPYSVVPNSAFLQFGYNGSVLAGSASVLAGQEAFVETNNDYNSGFSTSIADLGSFNPGDTISVQFMVGNDTNTNGPNIPNWEIDSFTLSTVPEPSSIALVMTVLGFSAIGLTGRRRQV